MYVLTSIFTGQCYEIVAFATALANEVSLLTLMTR
jgi:hypothetical protein